MFLCLVQFWPMFNGYYMLVSFRMFQGVKKNIWSWETPKMLLSAVSSWKANSNTYTVKYIYRVCKHWFMIFDKSTQLGSLVRSFLTNNTWYTWESSYLVEPGDAIKHCKERIPDTRGNPFPHHLFAFRGIKGADIKSIFGHPKRQNNAIWISAHDARWYSGHNWWYNDKGWRPR